MRKKSNKKQFKTDEWNEKSRDREEHKTKEEDNDWDKKNEEMGDNENNFHEGDYET